MLGLAGMVACGPAPGAGMEALTGATVVDVVAGRSIPSAVILIRDGHIVAVGSGPDFITPRGAQVTDLSGRWIIPGLIDAHAHLQPWALASNLRYGVTAVRDLHDGLRLADTLAHRASGWPAPHLFLARAMLDVPPTTYPDALPVTSADDAARAIDTLAQAGATWIKTYTRVTPLLLEAVVQSAQARHLPVAAHLGETDALTAARLGVRSIEHLSGVPEAAGDSTALFAAHARGFFAGWTAFERSWRDLDTLTLTAVADDLAGLGVYLVPTLGLHETFARLDDSTLYHRADLASVPDSARANWNVKGMIRRAGWTRADFPDFRAGRPLQDFFVRTFVAAGGKVATGTDASNQLLIPGAGVHLEMELLVHAGLAPIDALRAGTLWGAELLHADTLGRLRPGTAADLVVLRANPLSDVANTRSIERVMLGGRWVPRDN